MSAPASAVLQALHVPDGVVVYGVLVDESGDGLMTDRRTGLPRACDLGTLCGLRGKPVVAWLCEGDIIGECSDCLERSARFDIHDQIVTLIP